MPPTPPTHTTPGDAPAAAPAAATPKPPATSPPPEEMLDGALRTFLEEMLRTGEPVTVETKRDNLTGRIFRMMLHEGWIAIEHIDGRRRAFFLIEGGKIASTDGRSFDLPSVPGK